MLQRQQTFALAVWVVGGVLVTACGQPTKQQHQQPTSTMPTQAMGPVELGALAVEQRGCGACHTSDKGALSGSSAGVNDKRVFAPNLTPDRDTGLGTWSDENIVRAIRVGVDDEGRTLCSDMPRAPDLSDEEAKDIVAYLRSLPAISNKVASSQCDPSTADLRIHGELIVRQQGCATCHGAKLSGSDTAVVGTTAYGTNLTPDLATGLGSWSTNAIITAIKTGVDDEGAFLCNEMPRFTRLSDDELHAVAAYLQSLAPISHQTQESVCRRPSSDPAVLGQMAVTSRGCETCHGVGLKGNGTGLHGMPVYAPNLTPDLTTGLGSWTEANIISALRLGVDDEGAMLCAAMPRYPTMPDTEAKNIVAYLKSLAPIMNRVPESMCGDPNVYSIGDDDAGTPTPRGDAGTPPPPPPPVDAGTPPPPPPVDAGTPPPPPPVDAGTTTTPDAGQGSTQCGGTPVVISQVYGGGGNTNAVFNADFVELHNRSTASVNVSGWAIQYASAAGTSWTSGVATIPTGTVIGPGAYVVLAVGAVGTRGASLPSGAVALSKTVDLSASSGKVALTTDSVPLSGACPNGASVVDFLGYGTANCAAGGFPGPTLSSTTAALRGPTISGSSAACVNDWDNSTDFGYATPTPRTSANVCTPCL